MSFPSVPSESSPAAGARYRVFLSYSHSDTKWAQWLMRQLEGYRVPERFHGRTAPIGEIGARIAPVFRDRDELPTSADLGDTIRTALRESATLVVICSPESAKSRWVRNEILEFKRLGGSARVFAFIVGGEPKAEGTDQDCFSPALRHSLGPDGALSPHPAEHIAADARPHGDGRVDACLRLIAGLLGVGFDDLRQRERARRRRRLLWITAGAIGAVALTLGLSFSALKARRDADLAREDAQRRQERSDKLVTGMLEELKARLLKGEKVDALDESSARIMASFQALDPRDLTDNTLTQQAKALTQFGQIRITQLRYAEAETAFTGAYHRCRALLERHPGNGEVLFERAQAEYWIGFVHYKRGNLTPTGEWFERYRDSAVALVALDPKNPDWQREAVSSFHNLAVLELERGSLEAARTGFLREREMLGKLIAANPKDLQFQFSAANADSFLGTVAERAGDFSEAIARFQVQTKELEAVVTQEPQIARWRRRLGDAVALESTVLSICGRVAEAAVKRQRAQEIFEQVSAQDATNRDLQTALLNARLREAMLRRFEGNLAAANQLVREARPALEKLVKSESSDRAVTALLATCWRLEAQLRETARDASAADAAAQAITIGRSLVTQNRATENNLGEYGNACVVAGLIARGAGDADAARRHWQTAVEAIATRGRESQHWRLLDPLARALTLLGRANEAGVVLARLQGFGYQPLEAWPESGR
jgi:tetratricopeptide (TPR) repeat protein